jgi:hypothetical protein
MNIKALKEQSPFILFLPFLVLYIFYVLRFHTDAMEGDEARYIQFAQNLLHGFYSPPYPKIDLINGPGYPILLVPFVALKLPLISITLFNAVLHYLSIVLLYRSVLLITDSIKKSLIVSVCWGSYFLAWQEMPCTMTETVTLFLISLFSFLLLRIFKEANKPVPYNQLILAGFILGFLILTKVIFAYAVVFLLVITTLIYLLNKASSAYKYLLYVIVAAMITISPYLIYTYHLTGKVFYLSSEGGKVLYWMTSTNENEYGDWNNNYFTANCKEGGSFCNADLIRKNHEEDIQRINNTKTVLETDSLFKAMAVRNIKAHPVKYVKNWFANIGRLLFGFPASYYFQSPTTLVRIYINSLLLIGMLYSLFLTILNWKNMPPQILFLVALILLYLFDSSLVSAYPRQFTVIVPAVLIWMVYVIGGTIKINWSLKTTKES